MTIEMPPETPPIGIALGGGAARGLCHIGVLKVLSSRGTRFPIVTGTSMGAIIGAAYVCGKLNEAESIARSVTARTMSTWADLNLHSGSLKGDAVKEVFRRFVGDTTFADLRDRGIKFTVVAADLSSEEPVYISEGRVDDAVRASMSIPGIFEPTIIGDRVLVDGGLIDNVPVEAARALGAEKVVGVEVYNSYDIWLRTVLGLGLSLAQMREMKAHIQELVKEQHVPWQRSLEAYRGMSRGVAAAARPADSGRNRRPARGLGGEPRGMSELMSRLHIGATDKSAGVNEAQGWTALRAALAALDIVTSLLERGREPFKANAPADLFIRPDVRRFHAHQFYKAEQLISAGERAALDALPEIEALVEAGHRSAERGRVSEPVRSV